MFVKQDCFSSIPRISYYESKLNPIIIIIYHQICCDYLLVASSSLAHHYISYLYRRGTHLIDKSYPKPVLFGTGHSPNSYRGKSWKMRQRLMHHSSREGRNRVISNTNEPPKRNQLDFFFSSIQNLDPRNEAKINDDCSSGQTDQSPF